MVRPFDDGVADGLPAAPTDARGNTRVAGTITARKQTSNINIIKYLYS